MSIKGKEHLMRRAFFTATSVAVLGVAALAYAKGRGNERTKVTAVRVDGTGEQRAVRIETDGEPTFTVFRLSEPMRVVVDVSGGDVAQLDGPFVFDDGMVNQVAVQQFSSGGFYIARLIIGLNRDVAYDVKAEGRAVVVRVAAPGATIERAIPPPAAPLDLAAKERLDAARKDAEAEAKKAADERKLAEAAADKARAQQEEAKRVAAEAEQASKAAAQAKSEAEKLRKQAQEAADRDRSRAEAAARDAEQRLKQVQEQERALAASRADAERLATQAERTRRDAEEAAAAAFAKHKERVAELEARVAAAQGEKRAAEEAQKRALAAKQDAERAQKAAEVARLEAEKQRKDTAKRLDEIATREQQALTKAAEVERMKGELEREKQSLAGEKRALEAERQQLAAHREEAARAKAEAERQAASAAKARQEQEQRALAEQRAHELKLTEAKAEAARLAAEASKAAAEEKKAAAAEKREAARLAAEARKAAAEAAAQVVAQQKQEAERLAAAAKLEAERRAAEERETARLAAATKQEAARAAAEEKATARIAAATKREVERAAAEEKREAARTAAEEKREAARLAAEASRDAERLRVAEQQEAARRAAEEERLATRAPESEEPILEGLVAPRAPLAQIASSRAEVPVAKTVRLRGVDRQGKGKSAGVLLSLDGHAEYVVERVADPPRLVVDLKNTKRATKRTTYGVDAPHVKRVRLGEHEGMLRAVFDLASADAEHEVTATDGGILVSMRTKPQAPSPTVAARAAEPAGEASEADVGDPTEQWAGGKLTDVKFEQSGTLAKITLQVTGEVTTKVDDRSKKAWVLSVDGASVGPALEKSLDTSAYAGAVRLVSTYQASTNPPTVNVVAQLAGEASQRVVREGGKLVWEIRGSEAQPIVAMNKPQQTAGYASEAAVLARALPAQTGRGKRVSLNFKDADIVNVIQLVAEVTGENIITSEEVKGKVTVKLRNVPWETALDTILKSKGYDKVRQNNIIRVAPAAAIQAEREAEVARLRANEQIEETLIKIITVNYANAEEITGQLKPLMSGRGTVQTDMRTNTLIVQDVRSNIDRLVELTKRLDKQTPQVLIEARIVEATSNYEQALGIQWGGTGGFTANHGHPTGLAFPGELVAQGAVGAGEATTGVTFPGRYAINMPAVGATSGVGFIFGSAGGSQLLQLRLTALETSGNGRIVSSPRITTLDNRKAKISQGVDIPITVISAAGPNTRFVSANLELEVTPHVTNDASILMRIKASKNEPNFSRPGAFGDPTIEKREAETEVLVRDGDTTVIGGIYTRNTTKSNDKVPFLGDLPIIGALFRSNRDTDDRSELLVFITPRIVNRQESTVASGEALPNGG